MENIFVEFLPPWVETGLQPAFYDKESGTVLQQTARMYARVNMLIRMFNKLSKNTKTTVEDYINQFNELHDYVHDYFDNLDVQEEIDNKLDEMAEDGQLKNIFQLYLEEEINSINNKVDSAIDRQDAYIENALENTKSGAPIPVASTSAMTDTNRIYVNTTDGKWYYYNGTIWTIGGTYQSTGIGEKTVGGFQLSDQAKNGIFRYITETNTNWGPQGIWNGGNVTRSGCICTNDYILFDVGDIIEVVDGTNYTIKVTKYDRESKQYESTSLAYSTDYVVDEKAYYRIEITSTSNTRPSIDSISEIISYKGLTEKPINPVEYGDLGFINKTVLLTSEIELGNINESGNTFNSNTRFRTVNFISVKKGMVFNLKGDVGVYFLIKCYDKDKQFIGDKPSSWAINGSNHFFKIDFDGYAKVIFKLAADSAMESSDLALFKNYIEFYETLSDALGFEVESEVDLSDVTMPNKNILTISAHRGQCGNQYPENTILAYSVAANNKFDQIETDVRFTSDEVPVICHDSAINRTARYDDGSQLQETIYVGDHTYSYLSQFDYGIYKGSEYAGMRLLTFDDVCKFAKFYNIGINIDVKETTASQATTLMNTVKKYGMTKNVKWTVPSLTTGRNILNLLPTSKVRIGAYTPSSTTLNNVLTLRSEYPNGDVGIDLYVGNTSDELFEDIQENNVTCCAFCENNTTEIVRSVLKGVEELTINNELPYTMLKNYYDSL